MCGHKSLWMCAMNKQGSYSVAVSSISVLLPAVTQDHIACRHSHPLLPLVHILVPAPQMPTFHRGPFPQHTIRRGQHAKQYVQPSRDFDSALKIGRIQKCEHLQNSCLC